MTHLNLFFNGNFSDANYYIWESAQICINMYNIANKGKSDEQFSRRMPMILYRNNVELIHNVVSLKMDLVN